MNNIYKIIYYSIKLLSVILLINPLGFIPMIDL